MVRNPTCLLVLAAFGCTDATFELTAPHGSSSIAATPGAAALYVANHVHESIARFEPESEKLDHIAAAGEPTRIAQLQERLFVTLRSARALGVYDGATTVPTYTTSVELGAEPFGVVVHAPTNRVFVTVSLEDLVYELDATTLEILRKWPVAGEPRGLAVHPSGAALFVVTLRSRQVVRIDLRDSARSPEALALPELGPPDVATLRLTGDPTVAPDGRLLHIPGIYVVTASPIPTNPTSEYYGHIMQPAPVIIAQPLDDDAEPELGGAAVISLVDYALYPPLSGAPSGVAVSHDSALLAVPIEGAEAVVVVGAQHDSSDARYLYEGDGGFIRGGRHIGFEPRPVTTLAAPAGTTSVLFTDNRTAWVYGFIDRSIAELDIGEADPRDNSLEVVAGSKEALPMKRRFEVAPSVLSRELEVGQRLFYSTMDPNVTRPGSGVSCALCHVGGRDDGMTWFFDIGQRQTPSLAGRVSLTEPVRWEGQRATVAENAMMTSRGMSPGNGMSPAQAQYVADYIDWTRIPTPRAVDSDAIERGAEVFARVGCASCHAGPAYTDNAPYRMFGLQSVRTRSLVGVGATAPYLHDGRAATLRDVVRVAQSGAMGAPFTLSSGETDDLVRFLESL